MPRLYPVSDDRINKTMTTSQLTINEAAEYCGKSERTIMRWIQNQKIEATRSDGKFAIERFELDAFLAQQKPRQASSSVTPTELALTALRRVEPEPRLMTEGLSSEASPMQNAGEDNDAKPSAQQPESTPEISNSPLHQTPSLERALEPTARVGTEAGKGGHPKSQHSSRPPYTAKNKRAAYEKESHRMASCKKHRRKAKRRRGTRGAIRFAKNAMRYLDLAQMREVRNWLLNRIDARTREV